MHIKNNILYAAMAAGLGMALVLPSLSAFAQVNISGAASAGLSGTVVSPGTANVNANVNATVKVSAATVKLISNAQTKADEEITRRDDVLNALNAKIQAMQNLSATDKSDLSASVQSQLSALSTLEGQIQADASANSTTSLKTDIKSITASYRIFALVIPQGDIEVAADRIGYIAGIMQTLSGKLQTRISDAQASTTASSTTSASLNGAASALTDMNAKIADANTQAQAATSEVASLQPDNGSSTIMAANTAALKDARTKIQAAQKDLTDARADVTTILKALKITATANATSSASANVQ